jgi:hypothetical protein
MIYKEKIYNFDLLLQEFIQSMNEFTHNGTVKEFNNEQALSLARYYLHQCPSAEREELAENMATVLTTKYHYRNTEQLLSLNPSFELRILEKIRLWVKNHCEEPVKLIGFMIQWTFNFSARAFKSFIEPAVTQTALTYTLIINPVMLPIQSESNTPDKVTAKQTIHTENNSISETNTIRDYKELRHVKWYDDAIMSHLGKNNSDRQVIANRTPLRGNLIQPSSEQSLQQDIETPKPFRRFSLNIDRRRMDPITEMHKAKASTKNTMASHIIKEIRPYAEIHSILMENDYKFQNCVKPFRAGLKSNERRLSVRFDINPMGAVSNIAIGKIISKQEIAQRLTIQLMQLRFSKVDSHLGYQTVYHTFFF